VLDSLYLSQQELLHLPILCFSLCLIAAIRSVAEHTTDFVRQRLPKIYSRAFWRHAAGAAGDGLPVRQLAARQRSAASAVAAIAQHSHAAHSTWLTK